MTYATRRRGRSARTPARIAGRAECRSAVTTGMPSMLVGRASAARCGEASSSAPSTTVCSGVYRALTMCPPPVRSGGSRSGSATTSAYPPVPRPSASALMLSRTRSPGAGSPTSAGYASARTYAGRPSDRRTHRDLELDRARHRRPHGRRSPRATHSAMPGRQDDPGRSATLARASRRQADAGARARGALGRAALSGRRC